MTSVDLRGAGRGKIRMAQRQIDKDNKNWPVKPRLLTREMWPDTSKMTVIPTEIWRCQSFLIQFYPYSDTVERMSVNRTSIDPNTGHWSDKISWDELMAIKTLCGRGNLDAVEIYPKLEHVVNVANMRHIWILKEHNLDFIWTKDNK